MVMLMEACVGSQREKRLKNSMRTYEKEVVLKVGSRDHQESVIFFFFNVATVLEDMTHYYQTYCVYYYILIVIRLFD